MSFMLSLLTAVTVYGNGRFAVEDNRPAQMRDGRFKSHDVALVLRHRGFDRLNLGSS